MDMLYAFDNSHCLWLFMCQKNHLSADFGSRLYTCKLFTLVQPIPKEPQCRIGSGKLLHQVLIFREGKRLRNWRIDRRINRSTHAMNTTKTKHR